MISNLRGHSQSRVGFGSSLRRAQRLVVFASAFAIAGSSGAQPAPKQPPVKLLDLTSGTTAPGQSAAPAGPARKGFQRPAAPASGPAPFLSEAVSWDIEKFSKFSEQLVYPTKNKTDAPFYDVPFAVNVPFEVPFDGGTVRVFFDVNIVWDEPEQRTQLQAPGSEPRPLFPVNGGGWNFFHQGVYRMDGTAIPANTAKWEVDGSESRPMTWQTDAPFPLLLNGEPPTATRGGSVTTRVDINSTVSTPKPRRAFTNDRDEHGGFFSGRPFVLQPAQPGWYALWFTLNPKVWAWPPKPLRGDDTLRAKIFVHYIVARRERANGRGDYFNPVDLEFIWTGADKQPTVPIDPNLVRAYTVEIPVTLRRDGWVFARAEFQRSRPANDFLDFKAPTRESDKLSGANVAGTVQPNARGFSATYTSAVFERANQSDPFFRQPTRSVTLTWEVKFPSEILDGGAGVIEAAGAMKKEGGNATFKNRWLQDSFEDYLPRSWIDRPGRPGNDPHGVGSLVEIISNSSPNDKADYIKSWGWKLADPDGSRFWQFAPNTEPPGGSEPKRFTVFAGPMAPHVANAWTKDLIPIIYKDLGPQPLFQIDAGPWRIEAHYRRKKDADKIVSGTPVAGATKVANEKDEFWEWYPKYSRLLRAKLGEVGKLEDEIALERELWQQQRRTARLLLDAAQTANDPGSWTDWFASSDTRAQYSEAMLARLMRSAGQANTKAFEHLTAIKERILKIRQAHEAIVAELDRVFLRYIDRHPELTLYMREQRALLEASDFKNALGTGDLGLFQAALARANLQPDSLQPEALVAMAQLQLENGDTMGAVKALRSAVRQDPKNEGARSRLRDVECSIIKVALEKSQGAIADARRYFYGYLKERGFGDKDQAWIGGMRARGLARYQTEGAWAVFSTGVTGAVSGLLGRAEQEARALDATERDMTAAFLGGHAILRLRMRGLMLSEIKSLPTLRLQEELMADNANGPSITREHALHLGLAIHQAFQLPELDALISEDARALQLGLAKGYWNDRDVGNTWAEWVGDITSPKNLAMMLMPMSIGRVGGQLQGITYWSRAEASFLHGAMRTGYVDSGTMVVARMLNFDRALGAIGGTKAGESFIKLLERSQQYQESLGLFGQAGWTIGKFVSVMALQGLAVHEAEELGGPQAALAVEAMLLFGGDTDLLIKFLDGAHISRQTARLALDHFVLTAEKQQLEMLAIRRRLVDLEQDVIALEKGKARASRSSELAPPAGEAVPPGPIAGSKTAPLKAGGKGSGTAPPGVRPPGTKTAPLKAGGAGSGTSPPGEIPPGGVVDDALSGPRTDVGPLTDPRPVIPNGQPGNDILNPIRGANEGLDQSTNNGASAAGEALASDLDEEARLLLEKLTAAKKLSQKLTSEPIKGPLPPRPEGPKARAPAEFGGYEVPPQPAAGSTWEQASRAKFGGNYEEAENLLLQMKKEYARDAAAGRPLGPHDLPLDLIEDELALVRELKTSPDAPAPDRAAAKAISAEIADDKVAQILALKRTPLGKGGAAGPIGMTEGGDYIVKEVAAYVGNVTDEEVLEWMVNGEVVGTALRHAAGLPMPGINVKPVWITERGIHKMINAQIVYRRVPGPTLERLTAAEQFLLHEQLSEHHGLDVLFGDFDGKSDNFMTHAGVAFKIDSGMADPRGLRLRHFDVPYNHPNAIHGSSNGEHWYLKAFERRLNYGAEENALILQTWRLHSAMTAEPAMRGVNRLKAILANPAERENLHKSLREAYRRIYGGHPVYGEPARIERKLTDFADETIKFMEERFIEVEKAIRQLNTRNGMPPLSATAPVPRRAHSFPESPIHNLFCFLPQERMAA